MKALTPSEKRDAVQHMVSEHRLSVKRSCSALRLSRAAYYKPRVD